MALRKSSDARPQISEVFPVAAIPGGEFQIRGKGLAGKEPGSERVSVRFGDAAAPIVIVRSSRRARRRSGERPDVVQAFRPAPAI